MIQNIKSTTSKKAMKSGKAGKLKWTFTNGVLTFSGKGAIPDYDDYQTDVQRKGYIEKMKFGNGDEVEEIEITHKPCDDRTEKGRSPWYLFRKEINRIVFNGQITFIQWQ